MSEAAVSRLEDSCRRPPPSCLNSGTKSEAPAEGEAPAEEAPAVRFSQAEDRAASALDPDPADVNTVEDLLNFADISLGPFRSSVLEGFGNPRA